MTSDSRKKTRAWRVFENLDRGGLEPLSHGLPPFGGLEARFIGYSKYTGLQVVFQADGRACRGRTRQLKNKRIFYFSRKSRPLTNTSTDRRDNEHAG